MVSVGRPQLVAGARRQVETAIWKAPVAGRVAVRGVNLDGDDQADRSVHGGPDKAVYAYALEDTERWAQETGEPLGAASFGENLSTRGVAVSTAVIGERWQVGSTLLEVRQPRVPCFKLGLRLGDPGWVRRFAQGRRPGAYLGILEEGELGAGDAVTVVHRPAHGITSAQVFEVLLHDRTRAHELRAAPELAVGLREWIRELDERR